MHERKSRPPVSATARLGDHGCSRAKGPLRRGRACTIIFFWLVNVWPGWQVVLFLDDATTQVLGIFNASLLISVAVNLANVAVDQQWVRATGEIITSCVGLAVFARFWTIHPFDFGPSGFNWNLVVRVVLILACAGCIISTLVQFVTLFRLALGTTPGRHHRQPRNRTGHVVHSERQ